MAIGTDFQYGLFRMLEIVWSVFAPEDQYGTSSRFVYRATRRLNRNTRLWGPRRSGFYAASAWGEEANEAAAAIKAAFLRGEECPDKDRSLQRRCIGDSGRDERIYGGYAGTTVVLRVPALPDSCILPVSVSQPAIVEAGLRRRSRGDLSLVQRSGRSTRSRAEVVVAEGGFFGTVVRAGSELRSTARTFGGLVAGRGEAHTGFV